jgi:hypothetical protein
MKDVTQTTIPRTAEHRLKTLPQFWDAISRTDKNFEVRRDDRGFQKGDILILQKHDGNDYIMDYSKKPKEPYSLRKRITYILTGAQFGIEAGYVVMGLEDDNR